MRPSIKEDGFKYWKLILRFVEYVLTTSHDTKSNTKSIHMKFHIKYDKIEDPDTNIVLQLSSRGIVLVHVIR